MRGAPSAVRVAPLGPSQLAAARELLAGERARELLERALGGTRECVALAATGVDTGDLAGVVLHGEVAGTHGTGALLWLVVHPSSRRRGVGRALLDASVDALRSAGARIVVAEVADSPEHQGLLALLRARGFVREGSVADFYRDGVALTLWVLRPG